MQIWEAERGLPVHRIPGTKGWTVYAYVEELDDWMADHAAASPGGAVLPVASANEDAAKPAGDIAADTMDDAAGVAVRVPGLLVLPFRSRDATGDARLTEALAEATIVHFASRQPSLRVASWTTTCSVDTTRQPAAAIARTCDVRYLVEGTVEVDDVVLRVDVRIVDAEVDRVLLTNRLVTWLLSPAHAIASVAQALAEHFALLLEGTLVEPRCIREVEAGSFLQYLEGVRLLESGARDGDGDALRAFDRCLALTPDYVPARGMRAIALLERARRDPSTADECIAQARAIARRCERGVAPLTCTFLDAAMAIHCEYDRDARERALWNALRVVPPATALRARLSERRAAPRAAQAAGPHGVAKAPPCDGVVGDAALELAIGRSSENLVKALLGQIAATCTDARRPDIPRGPVNATGARPT